MKDWDTQAEALWVKGKRQAAINCLLETCNQSNGPKPKSTILQLSYYFFLLQDFVSGDRILSVLLEQDPKDLVARENRGVMRHRLGRYQEALADFELVVQQSPKSVNAWDGITAVAAKLKLWDTAKQAGEQSLNLKDKNYQHYSSALSLHLPQYSPQAWDAEHQGLDVIAFSLWGKNPIYLRGAVQNLLEAQKVYPDWVCRFYVDRSVPADFCSLVKAQGGQVIVEEDNQPLRQKLCWRFQVANDPTVRRFLVRDCDSVISAREANAVCEWLSSDRWFHVMRDWWTHTDLMLAGMWGGRAGLLSSVMAALQGYTSQAVETPNIDQWFLRDCLWHILRDHCLIHDRCFRVLGARVWPDPSPADGQHVGQNEAVTFPGRQDQTLGSYLAQYTWLQLPNHVTHPLQISPRTSSSKIAELVRYQRIANFDPSQVDRYQSLTYPNLMKRWQRTPPQGQIIAISASVQGQTVGLVVAERTALNNVEILSLFVLPNYRQNRIGTGLLKRLEKHIGQYPATQLHLNYQQTWLTDAALEPILERLDWQPPETVFLVATTQTELISQAPWLKHRPLPHSFEVFPWTNLTPSDRKTLQTIDFPESLSPFCEDPRLDPLNSIGLRHDGTIVGWMLTHRVAPDTIRYSTLYVCEPFQALGRGITLISLAIKRQIESTVPYYKFAVAAENKPMLRFVERRLSPFLTQQGEARQVQKVAQVT